MYVLLVTLVYIVIFCLPYYLSFKIKNAIALILTLSLALLADSYLYYWGNASGNVIYGIIHLVVGISTLLIFFFRAIKQRFEPTIVS